MPKYIFLVFFLCFTMIGFAQIDQRNISNFSNRFEDNVNDTIPNNSKEIKVELSDQVHYTDYKVIDYKFDTVYVDTTMSLNTYYKHNFRKKDNFEYQEFQNQGQPLTTLAYSFSGTTLFPTIGASSKHLSYLEIEDIKYYEVPTPTSILFYRTGMEQGQMLDAAFSFNFTPQFNVSVAHTGLRSLGFYRQALSDHGKSRLSLTYFTKDKRYFIRAHVAAQNLKNEESGGLTDESIENFESGDSNFKDRGRIVTQFTDAQNVLRGNRYFVDHFYKLWQEQDSVKTRKMSNLSLGHTLNYERKNFQFFQDADNDFFGEAFTSSIEDKLKYTKIYNEVYAKFTSPFVLGDFKVYAANLNYDYNYKAFLVSENETIPAKLDGNVFNVGAEWKTNLNKFNIHAHGSTILAGDLNGYFLDGKVSYALDSLSSVSAGVYTNSRAPNFNYTLFQSNYKSYNWYNDFDNVETSSIYASINSEKWLNFSAELTSIQNYTYFDDPGENGQTKAMQADDKVNYLKLKLSKEIRFGKFALDNSFIYQNVSNGEEFFRVPEFITRNSFYFSSDLFKKKPLFLQTGITFSYFTEYYMNEYNPLLSEFNIQNEQKFGGYPMFDFFVNARIRRTRLYLLLEHFNAAYTGFDYYSAPAYPYRDFTIRFGLVWNFFI